MAARIFICDRRENPHAHAVYSELSRLIPASDIFFDRVSIQPGAPWPGYIQDQLRDCAVMLVQLHNNWHGIADPKSRLRRIDEDGDRVRKRDRFWRANAGENLASSDETAVASQPWPRELAGASVTVNGAAALLSHASPGRIMGQIPPQTRTGQGQPAGDRERRAESGDRGSADAGPSAHPHLAGRFRTSGKR